MSGGKETRPSGATLRRAMEPGTLTKLTTVSAVDSTISAAFTSSGSAGGKRY